MMVAERQRQKRFSERRLQKSIARLLEALQREMSEVEAEVGTDGRGSPSWREKEEFLASVPGVGPTIARTLIAEMLELGTLDCREIAGARPPRPLDPPVRPVEGAIRPKQC